MERCYLAACSYCRCLLSWLHLRLGQCHLDLDALDLAAEELMRAYVGAGAETFKDQDPKYLRLLQSKAKGVERPKKPWQFWK